MTTTAADRPRLLLIDGHSVAYRAFYALPVENFSTSTGQHTNAVYGFTSMLINVLRDEAPTHVAVAFDVSRHTFRTDVYADYKGTRAKSPDEFKGQVELIKEVLDALRIPHLEVDNYEADDIIATLNRQSNELGWQTLICTGDRDSLQLVDADSTVLYPRKGVSDLMRFTPEAVEEKYGVPPYRYPEIAALVGETSDNLPGVPGVGPKTAAKWIAQYDGLENILAHIDEIKGKAGDSLREHADDVRRNRELNALVDTLDLPLGPTDLGRQDWDREAVHTLFDALEFRVLRDRLMEALPTQEPQPDGGLEIEGAVLASGELGPWLDAHATSLVGMICEGTWHAGTGDVRALALASQDSSAAYVDVTTLSPDDDAALAAWLADPRRPKALHDAKGQLEALWARGWQVEGLAMDTQLAAYLLRPDQRVFDLGDLTIRHLHRELSAASATPSDQDALFASETEDAAAQDAMVRAKAVVELAVALATELSAQEASSLLVEVEQPLQRVLARMEQVGIAVDTDYLEQLYDRFDAEVQSAQQAAWDSIGKQINLGSPKQLQTVLFDDLDMPKTRKTRTGYTTDADALESLYAKTEHPFLEHLLRHRDQIRLRQTVEGLQKSVADDGRIHTTYLQTVAATGRLSSTDPNLQNIPIRTEDGRLIRQGFVVGEGYEALMSVDYSQIEMRIMAHLSQDAALIEAFTSGYDFHAATAARVFDVPIDEVSPAQRAKVKAMNYGLAYGLSAFGLSGQLRISTAEARALMDDYFESFGHARAYLDGLVAQARRTGYTETILGRRRYLPDLNSSNRQRREMAERMALNAPIQGSAADIIKVAMLDVDEGLRAASMRSRVLLQVHDELVVEVAPGEAEALEALLRDRMGHAMDLSVPLDVSVGVGRSWHEAAH